MDRGDVDDRAPLSRLLHRERRVLDAEEHSAQIDRKAAVELFNRRLRHLGVDSECGVVDIDVQAAELRYRKSDERLNLVFLGDVAGYCERATPVTREPLDHRAQTVLRDVGEDDRGALTHKLTGNSLSDPLCGAGDDRNASLEAH